MPGPHGADHVIGYASENVTEQIKKITGRCGVDLNLNRIAGEATTAALFLASLGTEVVFGFLAGPPAGTFAEDLAKHFQKSVAVRVSDIHIGRRIATESATNITTQGKGNIP